MGLVTYSAMAREDMASIWLWIATKTGITTADMIADRIEHRIAQLADTPLMGPARPEIGEGARHLVCERWLALYRVAPGGVQVVRVVDGAQDLRNVTLPDDL
ncbi:MAG: type II toxin-antitoxin system RelE/ParE family toxin [Ancalomicrobiaceae bacterium]|nr:type II toxin-antitoxin system RelE/ParE family toxin [Ancalomicrobiaceae bacterium]